MPELKFGVEEPRGRIDTLTTWLPRVAVALAFLAIGYSKFDEHSTWVRTFTEIGFGSWFRYFTGVVQILGALLVLTPRTCLIGLALLSSTMVGAALIWIVVLHAPGAAVIPALILIPLVVVGLQARRA